MDERHFRDQVGRLAETFGANHYKPERIKLMWREVKEFDGRWFTGLVDEFIGESRHPPLLPEFREKITIERERLWKTEKQVHEKEAKSFYERCFPIEEVRQVCKTIIDRILGRVTDSDFWNFVKLLNYSSKTQKIPGAYEYECERCQEGYIFWQEGNGLYVGRCTCSQGQAKPKSMIEVKVGRTI